MTDQERQVLLTVLRETPEAKAALKAQVDQRRRERVGQAKGQPRERNTCADCPAKIVPAAQRCNSCEQRRRTRGRRYDEDGNVVEVCCATCREFKSVAEFAPSELTWTAFRSGSRRCRDCLTISQRERRAKIREQVRAEQRRAA